MAWVNPAGAGIQIVPRSVNQGLPPLQNMGFIPQRPMPKVVKSSAPQKLTQTIGPRISNAPRILVRQFAQPQMQPILAGSGGLLGNQQALGAGLLGAAGQFAKAGGPSAMPIQTGAVVGPALQAFAADYGKAQKEQAALALKKQMVARYGPAGAIPQALPALIKQESENQQVQNMQKIFEGGGDDEAIKARLKSVLGTDFMQQELGQMRTALATRDPKIVSSTFTGIVNKKFDRTTQFRKEFGDKTKNTSKIIRAAQQALRMLNANEGTGSTSGVDDLVTLYITITALDPASTVREGEVQLGREIMSHAQKIRLKLEQVTEARVLGKDLARDMRKLVLSLGQMAERSASNIETFYKDQAEYYALNPDRIISPRHKLPKFSQDLLKKSRLSEEGAFR